MARTSTDSNADDYVVDRVEPTASDTPSSDAVAASGEGTPKRSRFGRRKAANAVSVSDATTAGGTPVALGKDSASDTSDKADKAGKADQPGKTDKAGKTDKTGKTTKSDKASRKRPALSAAARLARVVTVLGMIALILAVVLVVQLVKGPGDGAARADQEDRKEAARSAAEVAVARLFSFDYKTLDADFAAQKAQTTGDFTGEVDKVTNPAVRPLATKEHVVVQAVSVASATVDDPGPDVQVIIFLNQAVTLDLLPAPRLDRNRVLASMRLVDGQWKVAGIKAL